MLTGLETGRFFYMGVLTIFVIFWITIDANPINEFRLFPTWPDGLCLGFVEQFW